MAAIGPKQEELTGKVIRIISTKSIIINLGRNNGVELGDQFRVAASSDEIIDPDSNESYGHIYFQKDLLEVTELYDKFSILSKMQRVRVKGSMDLSMFSEGLYGKTQVSKVDIDVNKEQINRLSQDINNKSIQVGDIVSWKIS